ncbi:hypothetical protein [Desulfotomaculum sp. 1211_IL3151]|uniref:hypothetical protein n=1 Tax=Desulfotomaculum sp. 1211_IL3151 TaxID=3084055 RepID=UPI002FDAFCCB
MKKLLVAVVLALVLGVYSLGTTVFAVDQVTNAMYEESLDVAEDGSQVKSIFDKDFEKVKKLIDNDKSFVPEKFRDEVIQLSKMGTPYKVYYAPDDFIEPFTMDGDFSKAVKGQVFWEVPLLDDKGRVISTSTAWKEQGAWTIAQTGLYAPVEVIEVTTNPELLYELLKDNNIEGVKKIKHVRSIDVGLDILYIKAKSGEYLLPFGNRPDITGLENLKVYTVDEVKNIWKELLEEQKQKSQSNNMNPEE